MIILLPFYPLFLFHSSTKWLLTFELYKFTSHQNNKTDLILTNYFIPFSFQSLQFIWSLAIKASYVFKILFWLFVSSTCIISSKVLSFKNFSMESSNVLTDLTLMLTNTWMNYGAVMKNLYAHTKIETIRCFKNQ